MYVCVEGCVISRHLYTYIHTHTKIITRNFFIREHHSYAFIFIIIIVVIKNSHKILNAHTQILGITLIHTHYPTNISDKHIYVWKYENTHNKLVVVVVVVISDREYMHGNFLVWMEVVCRIMCVDDMEKRWILKCIKNINFNTFKGKQNVVWVTEWDHFVPKKEFFLEK